MDKVIPFIKKKADNFVLDESVKYEFRDGYHSWSQATYLPDVEDVKNLPDLHATALRLNLKVVD